MRKAAQKRSKAKVAHCQNPACGRSFRMTRTWQKYCSARCAQAAYFARRLARTKGLALIYFNAFRVWLDDDTPDMARTMAALDRGLARAEWLMGVVCPGANTEGEP